MDRDELFPGIVILIFGGVTTLLSLKMPLGTFRMAGTGMFPLCLGILLIILSGIFILRIFFHVKGKQARKEASDASSESPIQLVLFLGAMALATLFLNQLGYPLTSFLLIVALLRTVGTRRWGQTIFISVVTALGSYFLFVKWLDIPLPKGWMGL